MARHFGKVSTSIWHSDKFGKLKSNSAHLLYMWLHTNPLCNTVGVYWFNERMVPPIIRRVRISMRELEAVGLIEMEAGMVGITNFIEHSPINSWQHASAAISELLSLQVCEISRKRATKVQKSDGYHKLRGSNFDKIGHLLKTFRTRYELPL